MAEFQSIFRVLKFVGDERQTEMKDNVDTVVRKIKVDLELNPFVFERAKYST